MAETTVTVDVSQVLCKVDRRVIGINVNYLVDHDANRPPGARPLRTALKEMGVRSLRFPGGDKSDNHLWSVPPFDRPNPTLACGPTKGREVGLMSGDGQWRVRLLDFDAFMALCRSLRAEPTVVVCYDALHFPNSKVTKRQLIETAVGWVEYANRKKKYGVKYWEIGNEAYIDSTVSLKDYARDVVAFARAMKAVDRSIMIGANGPSKADGTGRHEATAKIPWWREMFRVAADWIDFAAIHTYSCWKWGSYETYRDHGPGYPEADGDARGVIEAARRWGPPGFADRLRVAVTEWNSADWSEPGWEKTNDLGHGLVVFDLLGTLLGNDKVDMAQLWNTRWVTHSTGLRSLWDAVDDQNVLQPTGKALAIWSRFLQESAAVRHRQTSRKPAARPAGDRYMAAVDEPPRMRTFASYSPRSGQLSVFLINKDTVTRRVRVRLAGWKGAGAAERWLWTGDGPTDPCPRWSGPARLKVVDEAVAVSLPPDSLTVLALGSRGK